jgi:hypothetical protein
MAQGIYGYDNQIVNIFLWHRMIFLDGMIKLSQTDQFDLTDVFKKIFWDSLCCFIVSDTFLLCLYQVLNYNHQKNSWARFYNPSKE